jgi:glyoxylase-like metal-dependent hydrolase (beta-lactamase superfamily II)
MRLGHRRLVRVNAGLLVTSAATVFVDAGMSVTDGLFLWKTGLRLGRATGRALLVLTHHHSDHTFGMGVLRQRGVEVVAHAAVREFLADDQGRYKAYIIEQYLAGDRKEGERLLGDVQLTLPDRLIDADTVLDLGGEEIRLLVTPGHVPSALCVYHRRSGVLFAGDTVYEGTAPNTRFADIAARTEWVRQLQRLQGLEIRVVVPGHGRVCGEEEIARNIALLSETVRRPPAA